MENQQAPGQYGQYPKPEVALTYEDPALPKKPVGRIVMLAFVIALPVAAYFFGLVNEMIALISTIAGDVDYVPGAMILPLWAVVVSVLSEASC